MANHVSGTGGPTETGHRPELGDELVLAQVLRESVSTSPEAFSKTPKDIDNLGFEYWRKEIDSSTWAVIQRGDEVIGVAVARWPDREMDCDIDQTRARFIESVWIAPGFRLEHRGERLMRFLMEREHAKSSTVRKFFLWVFDNNKSAIAMYENMGFAYAGRQQLAGWNGGNQPKDEYKYEYCLEPDAAVMREAAAGRHRDERVNGLVYRVLGETR